MKKPKKGQPGDIVRTVGVGKTIVIDETTVTAESVKGRRVILRIRPRDRSVVPRVYPLSSCKANHSVPVDAPAIHGKRAASAECRDKGGR